MRVLLAGGGYVGSALAENLLRRGAEVWIVKRTDREVPSGAQLLRADLSDENSNPAFPSEITAAVYSVSAGEYSDAAYRRAYVDSLRNTLRLLESAPRFGGRILFLSSTGVYAQENGEWVNETSPAAAAHFSGRRLLEGEELLLASRFECAVIRFGGIYGPGRTRLVDEVRSGTNLHSGPPQFPNRIHRADCAGIIEHLLRMEHPENIYLGVDSNPAPRNDVVSWIAAQLGMPDPLIASSQPAEPQRGNKRCSNKRIVESGYVFRYPTFREGYAELILSG